VVTPLWTLWTEGWLLDLSTIVLKAPCWTTSCHRRVTTLGETGFKLSGMADSGRLNAADDTLDGCNCSRFDQGHLNAAWSEQEETPGGPRVRREGGLVGGGQLLGSGERFEDALGEIEGSGHRPAGIRLGAGGGGDGDDEAMRSGAGLVGGDDDGGNGDGGDDVSVHMFFLLVVGLRPFMQERGGIRAARGSNL